MGILSILFVVFVLPSMFESRIRKEAPALLELSDFKIVQSGDFSFWLQQVEYVVKKNDKLDTVYVKLTHGTLSIQPK